MSDLVASIPNSVWWLFLNYKKRHPRGTVRGLQRQIFNKHK